MSLRIEVCSTITLIIMIFTIGLESSDDIINSLIWCVICLVQSCSEYYFDQWDIWETSPLLHLSGAHCTLKCTRYTGSFLIASTHGSPLSVFSFNQWDKSEDRIPLFSLGFAAVVALWASSKLIGVIIIYSLFFHLKQVIGAWLHEQPERIGRIQ